MGRIIQLKEKMSVMDIVGSVKKHLEISHGMCLLSLSTPVFLLQGMELINLVQIAHPNPSPQIGSIAVCAGSGGSLFKGVQADLFLTGEMSHHEVLAAVASGSSVILCNHTNTERGYLRDVLKGWLGEELGKEDEGWEVVVSNEDKDPLRVV